MVLQLRHRESAFARVAGTVLVALSVASGLASASAQQPAVHYWHAGVMPPGAIGARQLLRGGPLPGYFQPVEVVAPEGVTISTAGGGRFEKPARQRSRLGLLIGQVYRLKVTNLPLLPGVEVFPTIEVIDRLYPPAGQEHRFPIPIVLTAEELEMAAAGKMVTRVIYLENLRDALPHLRTDREQSVTELGPGEDPLAAADARGRPVAILRMGGRVPGANGPDARFLFGCPPLVKLHLPADAELVASAAAPSADPPAAPQKTKLQRRAASGSSSAPSTRGWQRKPGT